MKIDDKETTAFNVTEKFRTRALELLDESQAMQFAEGLRLNSAAATVFARELERITMKYGEDHPRAQEIKVRLEASNEANTMLYARYTEAATPIPTAVDGWAVDGFVRTSDSLPLEGVKVAAYDLQGHLYREFGYSCTDEKGYFSIVVEKLPAKELRFYMRPSMGKKMLKSNENRLTPTAGTADRIEIIIDDRDGKGESIPPQGGKGQTPPPEKPGSGKEQPAADVKYVKDSPANPAKDTKDAVPAQAKAGEKVKPAEAASAKNRKPAVSKTKPTAKAAGSAMTKGPDLKGKPRTPKRTVKQRAK